MQKGKFIKHDADLNLEDFPMIGMVTAANRINLTAERFDEYFIKKKGHYFIIKKPTLIQKIWANIKHPFYSQERQKYWITSLDAPDCHVVDDKKDMRRVRLNLKKARLNSKIEKLKKDKELIKAYEKIDEERRTKAPENAIGDIEHDKTR